MSSRAAAGAGGLHTFSVGTGSSSWASELRRRDEYRCTTDGDQRDCQLDRSRVAAGCALSQLGECAGRTGFHCDPWTNTAAVRPARAQPSGGPAPSRRHRRRVNEEVPRDEAIHTILSEEDWSIRRILCVTTVIALASDGALAALVNAQVMAILDTHGLERAHPPHPGLHVASEKVILVQITSASTSRSGTPTAKQASATFRRVLVPSVSVGWNLLFAEQRAGDAHMFFLPSGAIRAATSALITTKACSSPPRSTSTQSPASSSSRRSCGSRAGAHHERARSSNVHLGRVDQDGRSGRRLGTRAQTAGQPVC